MQMEAAAALAETGAPVALTDCCNGADTAAQTGQHCEAGQDCHVQVLCLAPVPAESAPVAASSAAPAAGAAAPPGHLSASVWRPPTAG